MSKHIGIVGCSAEGAALCYKTICNEAQEFLGEHYHPEITMHTYSLGEYMVLIRKDDWDAVSDLMISSANKIAKVGAKFAICPDNTIHQTYTKVLKNSPIPWLHIAEAVVQYAKQSGYKKLAILGTKYLMEGPVYKEILQENSIEWQIPPETDRIKINDFIFTELVNGIFEENTRLYFNSVIKDLKDNNCDAVVLGCTEIPLIVNPSDCPLPTLDSTRLLARTALRYSIE